MSRSAQIETLLERSSLGEPDAKLLRSRTPTEITTEVLARIEEHSQPTHQHTAHDLQSTAQRDSPAGSTRDLSRAGSSDPTSSPSAAPFDMRESGELADLHLLEEWSQGVPSSRAKLYDRYYASLAEFFGDNVPPEAREDLIQETLLVCLQSTKHFKESTTFQSFLYASARDVLISYYYQRYERAQGDFPIEKMAKLSDIEPLPNTTMIEHEAQRFLLEALQRIPLKYQVVLALHYWGHLPAFKISKLLSAPLGTVKTRLRDGHIHLTEQLSKIAHENAHAPDPFQLIDSLECWARRVRAQVSTGPTRRGSTAS